MKAVLVKMQYATNTKRIVRKYSTHPATGQAAILSRSGTRRLVTAHCNVLRYEKCEKDGWVDHKLIYTTAMIDGDATDEYQGIFVKFRGENLFETQRPSFFFYRHVEWKVGWDVTEGWGSEGPRASALGGFMAKVRSGLRKEVCLDFDEPNRLDEMTSEVVSPKFEYKVGQKLVMLISSVGLKATATPESTGSVGEKTQQEIDEIYGPPDSVAIYTGEITEVGEFHICHNINSYSGCSGAAIYLWDGDDQHDSVSVEDHGKAIAVHVGFEPMLQSNIGLKINEGTTAPLWYRLRLPQWMSDRIRSKGKGIRDMPTAEEKSDVPDDVTPDHDIVQVSSTKSGSENST
ncbi:MAG: hypothetical protein SGILL_000843 [Bacillariaceae sp.]